MDESRPIPMFKCEQIESGRLAKAWQEWRGALECYFDSYSITDQKMKRSKMLHLGGPQLQKIFRSLDGTEDFPLVLLEKPFYDIAIERLDLYFKPRNQDVLERHKLRNMKQGSNERFSHFVLRLRQQLADCGFEKYAKEVKNVLEEIMLVDVIVEGCNSQELRRKILEKDQSLSEIESLGESLESVRLQEKELKGGNEGGQSEICKIRKSESRTELKTRSERKQDRIVRRFSGGRFSEKKEADVKIICYACGQFGHTSRTPSCPARGKTCRRCQKSGHFEKVCRKRSSDSQATQYTGKVHSVEDNDATSELEPPVPLGETEKKVYYTFYTGNDTNVFNCKIGGISTEVFIDSGSEVNLITLSTWEMLKAQQVIVANCTKGSNKVLKAYGCDEPLCILGTFEASVEIGNRSTEAEFIVTKQGQRNLLGDSTSKQLGILKIGFEINQVNNDAKLVPFSKISGVHVRIQMDPTVTPVYQPLRRVPIPLETAVNEKLDELLARDIIEVKRGPVSWVSPLVVANKANGQIRLCVDLRRVNQAVIRDRHPMPVIDDVLTKIGKGNVWSVLDVKDAFFQLELEKESRDATVFITHRGLYRFKRLPFGLVSAPEIFQRTMDEILADCEGAYWYLDDVGVEGKTLDEHDKRLNEVLNKFKDRGLVLNWDKCKIRVTEFDFLGYKINSDGIMPSDEKRNAVITFRHPANESEVRSFLGLANYMGKFIPNLAAVDEPLRKLTQKGVKFHWDEREESAFRAIKTSMANAGSLGFYKLEDKTSVLADASPFALGAVLIQTNEQGLSRVISFASKSLTDTERRYCQTEKEALALVWSIEKFQVYLIGREFNLLTDCKALTFLFTPTSRPCARIERWVLRLQSFQYKIVHISGQSNIADVLSRLSTLIPHPFDEAEELTVREVVSSSATTVALKWEEIGRASRDDAEIRQVIEALESGTEEDMPLPFKMISTELSRLDDILLRVDRIVIPEGLRQRVLQIAHEGHPGIRIMKSHLRTNVWWPKMDQNVEKYVKACRGCVLVSAPNQPEPMIRKRLPSRPWEQIAVDFLGPLPDGENLLVCIDYYSRFMEVVEMTEITTASTIKELLIIFSRYGVPESLRADNGPQFSSEEFQAFCSEYGVHLESTIPYWPQMNGEVERQNRSILKRLRIAQELGQDWRKDLRQYLLVYHSSNHSTTGKAPADLMFGRQMRTKLPRVPTNTYDDGEIREKDMIEKEKGRAYADNRRKAKHSTIEVGDQVLAKRMKKDNKLNSNFSPEQFSVIRKRGTDVTIRSSSSGKEFRRSAAHLKTLPKQSMQESHSNENTCNSGHQQESSDTLDRQEKDATVQQRTLHDEDSSTIVSKRTRIESSRLKNYITY